MMVECGIRVVSTLVHVFDYLSSDRCGEIPIYLSTILSVIFNIQHLHESRLQYSVCPPLSCSTILPQFKRGKLVVKGF